MGWDFNIKGDTIRFDVWNDGSEPENLDVWTMAGGMDTVLDPTGRNLHAMIRFLRLDGSRSFHEIETTASNMRL